MSKKIHPNLFTSPKTRRFSFAELEQLEETTGPITNLNINKCRCNKYIPTKDNKCGCGRNLNEHKNSVIQRYNHEGINEGDVWKSDSCTIEDGQTDAFGNVKFVNNNENISKYIRIHYKTEVNKIIDLLFKHWKLKAPKLLISVTGGAQRFSLKQRLQDVFRRGLVKAALSTGAWISTGGFNVGVMKHVGEAIREHGSTLNPDQKIVVLGIAVWDMISNKESLIRGVFPKDDTPVEYIVKTNDQDKKKPLDPNHTHFILVDSGKVGFGGEIEFRTALESAISKNNQEIPIVVLVLEGGVGTLKTVHESLKNGSPCVLVEGSGKCADILAFAFKSLEEEEKNQSDKKDNSKININDKLKSEIIYRIKKEWKDVDHNKTYQQVQEIVENYSNLLTVFSLDAGEKAYDIDVAILTSLLKANKENYINQLKLALTWNRVDIARDYIFTQDIKRDDSMNEIMYSAIAEDRVEFVGLLLENGFSLKRFLTYRRLLMLYNQEFSNKKNRIITYISILKSKKKINPFNRDNKFLFDFKQIGLIIQDLVEDLYEPSFIKLGKIDIENEIKNTTMIGEIDPTYKKDNEGVTSENHSEFDLDLKVECPEQELFMFSLLLARPGMAKIFWSEGNNGIFLALIASKIFKRLAKLIDEDASSLNEYANEFENLAVMTLNECYKSDEENSHLLLIRPVKEFKKLTALQVAVFSEALDFLSHASTQGLLTKLWYNKISPDISRWPLVFSVACPFLAPFLIDFREDKKNKITNNNKKVRGGLPNDLETQNSNSHLIESNDIEFLDSGKKLSFTEKIYFFVKAPYVKFIYNQVFYALFLTLFSYIMLCDFYPVGQARPDTSLNLVISVPEIILIIWVSLYSIDEIRQFSEVEVKMLKARFRVFFSTIWNGLEIMCIGLFFIGLILRFIPNNYDVYQSARVILCIDLVLWYLKSLSFYTVIRKMGPKLVMINRMLYELMYFIFIVIVFMFAFGVSTQSLMYHNQELNLELLKNVFFPSYFIIGGEYYTRDTIMTAGACSANLNANETDDFKLTYTQDDCPNKTGADVSLALYVGYLIILNILLVNLLIAIFSNTFDEVQNETDKIWKYQRYAVIYEYFHKPILTAPLNFFSYIISLIRIILRPIRMRFFKNIKKGEKNVFKRLFYYLSKDWKTGFVLEFDEKEEEWLIKWEDLLAEEYLLEEERSSKESSENKIQQALEKIEVLSRKFDDVNDKRSDLKEKIENIEDKMGQILNILENMRNNTNTGQNVKQNITEVAEAPKPQKQNSIDRLVNKGVLSPSNVNTLTEIDTTVTSIQILNEKSRTQHYPKSNSSVKRTPVPDNKVQWSILWPDYKPIEYTSKTVLNNPNADNNLTIYPPAIRPELDYNCYDEENDIDRISCLGKYKVENGLPINPIGRTGLTGRGLLNYWGPNHAFEGIITRWKRNEFGKPILDKKNLKILQFIAIEKSNQWYLPHIFLENSKDKERVLIKSFLIQVFNKEIINEHIELFKILLNKENKIESYYKDSQRNTDNAWIETSVVNYHDDNGDLLTNIPLKNDTNDYIVIWKDFNNNIRNENQDDWIYLKKIAELKNASFYNQ